jgi:hypothetical protein
MKNKELKDFTASYSCRFHPTEWFHETGCPHMEWTKKELQEALDASKQNSAYLIYLLSVK